MTLTLIVTGDLLSCGKGKAFWFNTFAAYNALSAFSIIILRSALESGMQVSRPTPALTVVMAAASENS